METTKGRNMPGEMDGNYDMPVRPAGPGYGATAEDIARGYSVIPNVDTDSRTGTYPPTPVLRRESGLI